VVKIEDYPLSSIQPEIWNRLIEDAGTISPFCCHAWLSLIAEAFPGWQVGLLLAEQGGKILAGLPYVHSRAFLRQQSHCLPWGTPAGVILAPGAGSELAGLLIEHWAGRFRTSRLPSRLAITFPDNDPPGLETLHRLSFRIFEQRSFAVRLSGRTFQQWEASLKQSVRNKNRQALKRGGVFQPVKQPEAASDIYRLARLTARHHKRPAPNFSERFYRLVLDPCGPLAQEPGLVRLYMVRVEGKPAAFNLCVVHSGRMWLCDHGADETTFQARPNNLIYRSIIELAFQEGLEAVDLGAVPETAHSLADFKLSLGGDSYTRLSAVKASLLFRYGAWLRGLYHRLR
jgi:predicted N-acyltransferase